MAKIGNLVVDLIANTASFTSGLAKSGKEAQQFKKALSNTFKEIAAVAAVAASAAGAVKLIQGAINAADEMDALSQKTGIATETLSGFDVAAKSGNTSLEALATGAKTLSKEMAKAAQGNEDSLRIFNALGVSVQNSDGTLRSLDGVLADVASKFSTYADGAGKSYFAQELLGKSGEELIPLLNQGAQGLAESARMADLLGTTIEGKTAKAADEFNDNLGFMGSLVDGFANQVANELTPGLAALSAQWVESNIKSGEFRITIDYLAEGIGFLAKTAISSVSVISTAFEIVAESIATLAAPLVLLAEGEWKRAWEALKDGGRDTWDEFRELGSELIATWSETAGRVEAAAPALGRQLAAPVTEAAKEIKKTREEIEAMLNIGDPEESRACMEVQKEEMKKAEEATKKQQKAIEDLKHEANAYTSDIAQGFTDMALKGEAAWDDIGRAMVERLFNRLINELIDNVLLNFLFGALFGEGAVIEGARAEGGPVMGGKTYLVGERGPELFVPSRSGTIVPDVSGVGGGTTIAFYQTNNFAVGIRGEVRAEIAEQFPRIKQAAIEGAVDAARRGGGPSKGLRGY